MSRKIMQDTAVITANNILLGQTHAYHHRLNKAEPEIGLYPTYLMVVNFTIGDDFYIPTAFIDEEKSTDDKIWLTLTEKEIEVRQYTRLPVDDKYQHEVLPLRSGESQKVIAADDENEAKPMSDTAPLPPGLQQK